METSADQLESLDEEFTIWKKNSLFLYDLVICYPLEWPSLTVQWIPQLPSEVHNKLVLGTHTSDGAPNYLMIAEVVLQNTIIDNSEISAIPKVEICKKIRVDGEVNRARCMPQNSTIVGAKTSSCEVYVFDLSKWEEKPENDNFDPDLCLKGHTKEGYGLSWNNNKLGHLISGSLDQRICFWDTNSLSSQKVVDPVHIYEGHTDAVEDVSWHPKDADLFGSVGDDCQLIIWDTRSNHAQLSVNAHDKEVNFLSFNPHNEWILATASSDTTIGVFDMRKLALPVHVLSGHTEEVFQVEWDPNHETILASSSGDRRLNTWDLSRIGEEQFELDADDGPAELLFSHGGHKAKVSDFSWNRHEERLISSVAEDNSLQIWQMADSIFQE